MNIKNLDSDSTTVIYSFLSVKEKAKISAVSKYHLNESEKPIHWKNNSISVNGVKLMTKSSITLYHDLIRERSYGVIGPWGGGETEYLSLIEKIEGLICFSEDPYSRGSYEIFLNILETEPMLCYRIINDPVFCQLLANKFPDQLERTMENHIFKKFVGTILVGASALIASIFCTIVLLPLWVAASSVSLILLGLPQLLPWVSRANLFTSIVLIPINIFHSVYYGARLGFIRGTPSIKNVISNVSYSIYSTFFSGKDRIDCCPELFYGPTKYFFHREKTIADIATEFERNNFIYKRPKIINKHGYSISRADCAKKNYQF